MILLCLHKAAYTLNTRVEMYKHRFIYRNAFGRRRSYSYSDCVSRREKRPLRAQRLLRKAIILMKDGTKITVDDPIIKGGFSAATGYWGLPKH